MAKTEKPKKLSKNYKFSLLHASIFILIFAILGGYFVWKSFAYTTSSVHVNFAPVGIANAGTNSSYWLVSSDGGVFSMGGAPFYGSLGSNNVRDIVGIASTPDHRGYWLVGADGGVFAFGDAQFHGSSDQVNPALPAGGSNSFTPSYPVTGITATSDGGGYWLIAQDGGLFAFGDAAYSGSNNFTPGYGAYDSGITSTPDGHGYWLVKDYGSVSAYGDAATTYAVPFNTLSGIGWNNRLAGITSTPDGHGYWLVGADGGVFAFGDAGFYGSMGGHSLNAPMVGIAATADGKGYWLVGADGGVFAFGDAAFYGSMGGAKLNQPIIGITSSPDSKGYLLVAKDGGVFAFGDAAFYGSMGGKTITGWVTGISMTPDGKGYFLVGSDGAVFAFGDATYSGRVVYPPPAVTFIASAPNNKITQGSPITLGWSTSHNALAVVFMSGPGIFGQYPLNGNIVTYPTNVGENVYNLVVIGAGGYVSTQLTINVLPPPPQVNIYFNPSSVTSGGASSLVWSASNATSISISGIGAVGPSGAIPITNLTSSNDSYTISAEGPNGSASATATLNLGSSNNPDPTTSATTSPAGLGIPSTPTTQNNSDFNASIGSNNSITGPHPLLCLDYNYASGHLPATDGKASLTYDVFYGSNLSQNNIQASILLTNNSLGSNNTATNCVNFPVPLSMIKSVLITKFSVPAYTSLRGVRLIN